MIPAPLQLTRFILLVSIGESRGTRLGERESEVKTVKIRQWLPRMWQPFLIWIIKVINRKFDALALGLFSHNLVINIQIPLVSIDKSFCSF